MKGPRKDMVVVLLVIVLSFINNDLIYVVLLGPLATSHHGGVCA